EPKLYDTNNRAEYTNATRASTDWGRMTSSGRAQPTYHGMTYGAANRYASRKAPITSDGDGSTCHRRRTASTTAPLTTVDRLGTASLGMQCDPRLQIGAWLHRLAA